MPLISPPTDEEPEPVAEERPVYSEFRNRWVKFYLDCPPWICPTCQCTNFGRNKWCPYCRFRLKKDTFRPDEYKENTYADYYFGGRK